MTKTQKTTFKRVLGGVYLYIYNMNTGTLHIEGYCQYAKAPFSSGKYFDTEKASRDFAGEKIQMCKICQKKREKIMKERG